MFLGKKIRLPIYTKLLVIAGLAIVKTSFAEEALWVYAKGTDTMPAGNMEIKLGSISRRGKSSGHYTFSDIRPEVEYGYTDKLTLSAELMLFKHDYKVADDGPGPMVETQGEKGFSKTQVGGYEVSAKYNFLSVYKDSIGLSLGAGYEHRWRYRLDGAKIDQDSFVITGYLQKNYFDDLLATSMTVKTEFERRKSGSLSGDDFVLEEEIGLDIAAGISYRVAPKWNLGIEFRHQSDYLNPQEMGQFDPDLQRSSFDLTDFRIGSQHQNGNYLGPIIHYAEKDWWLTAGVLWQIFGGGSVHADVRNNRNWDEHERVHFGLTFGYEL